MKRSITGLIFSVAACVTCAVAAQANTYSGSDWKLQYNMNGQIELLDGFISFWSGNVVNSPVTAMDLTIPEPGANFLLGMPFFDEVSLFEVDANSNFTVGDIGDKLKRVYGDDMEEAPILIDGATIAWMNPVLGDYNLEITDALLTTTIMGKNANRVYDLRDGKGFVLEGMAYAKEGTGRESGSFTASSKFILTRAVPEPSALAGLAAGFTSVVGLVTRRRRK